MFETNGAKYLNPLHWLMRTVMYLKFIYGCFRVIWNPYHLDMVLSSAQGLVTTERFALSQSYLASLPGGAEIIAQRLLLPRYDLEEFLRLPQNSFGHQFAVHMRKHNYDPKFYEAEFSDDTSYSFYRYGRIHDFLHIVTGFNTSIAGEVGVLSYSYAQSRGPGTILIVALALLHCVLRAPRDLHGHLSAFVKGWNLGMHAKPYFTTDWAPLFAMPLNEVRNVLNIQVERFYSSVLSATDKYWLPS